MGRFLRFWLVLAALAATPASARSQGLVVRDDTLGSGKLEVVGPGVDPLGHAATYLITPELGEQQGSNLFHSFRSFGIGPGETATFTGPDPIDGPQSVSNVISRVTGGHESQIDGRLRSTIPNADVWLLNPSGVVFGAGAQLDVPGSFHASTGDYLGFGEGDLVRFYGDPSRPSVLATAPPAAFGFLGEGPAAAISVTGATLDAPEGETLELVAGSLSLADATLTAPGGFVSLEAQGAVALTGSLVDVGVDGGAPGVVSIRAGRLVMTQGSKLLAENESALAVPPDQAGPGSITVAASESVLVDASLLSVNTSSAGNAGTIDLRGGAIILQNGGPGLVDFGSLPSDPGPHRTEVGARAETSGSGAAGRIEIHADSVEVLDGAGLSAQTVGADGALASGAGGVVQIVAADSVLVRGRGFVSVESWGSSGDAGAIEIEAGGKLTLDGDWLTTITAGSLAPTSRFVNSSERAFGKPGTIEITAALVELSNGGIIQSICSNCVPTRSSPGDFASGGGQIHITAGSLLADATGTLLPYDPNNNPRERFGIGSAVSVATFGAEGDAGRIVVDLTGALNLRGGADLLADSFDGATGKGGLVSVHADSVLIDSAPISGGEGARGTGITANSLTATSDAGKVVIEARSLVLGSERASWGSWIGARTSGSGKGGTIEIGTKEIPVESVVIGRTGSIDAGTRGAGNAGTITLYADALVITDEGTILANTAGAGAGGTISVDARTVLIERGGIIHAGAGGIGEAGTIDLSASESLLVTGAGDPRFSLAEIVLALRFPDILRPEITGIFSAGGSGSIRLEAPDITLTDGALVFVITGSGDAGDIFLSGERIYVRNGALVDSTSFAPGGNVGNITLEATERIEVAGSRAGVKKRLGVLEPFEDVSRVTSASLSEGEGGTVTLAAPRILIDGGAVATTALPSSFGYEGVRGGDITVLAGELIVRGGGRIDASSFIAGPGGNIGVTASDSIVVEGQAADGTPSGISSRTGASGDGGAVTLRAPVIELSEGGEVSAKSEADPNLENEVGRIFDSLRDDLVWIGTPPPSATGDAGSVTLAADEVRLFGGTIATNAEAADGGSVTIEAKDLVHLDAGVITATVTGGDGGDISIDPEVVILQNGSRIVADAGTGSGGNIQITADNYFAFPGSVVDASSELGIDGIVEVSTPDVDLAGTLTALPASYLDAASLMRERCAARRSGERAGSFAVRGNGGIPAEPDGWLPATVSFEVAPGSSGTLNLPAGPGGAALFALGSCR